jgi:hypothetical protein
VAGERKQNIRSTMSKENVGIVGQGVIFRSIVAVLVRTVGVGMQKAGVHKIQDGAHHGGIIEGARHG